MSISQNLIRFIKESPTEYQAVDTCSRMLENAGFEELREEEKWDLEKGGRYYVVRNDAALLAFSLPEKTSGIRIAASHADSPYFKIKENPEMEKAGVYTVLNVEKYGGMLMGPWFDRPLSVAGRLLVCDPDSPSGISTRLVDFDRDMLLIPSLAIHMDREANNGKKLNPQTDMLPLYSLFKSRENKNEGKNTETAEKMSGSLDTIEEPGQTPNCNQAAGQSHVPEQSHMPDAECGHKGFLDAAAEIAGVSREDILGYDLYVYNHQPGTIWGPEGEFVSAPRLDDLQCTFACLTGFLAAAEADAELDSEEDAVKVFALLDNEEVGSSTRQGAASTFLADTLHRIYDGLGMSFEDYKRDLAKGFMISADNAHAVHPNYQDKADPVNRPVIGGGVVLKFAGNQKYCTDGYSAALFRKICKEAGCKVQTFTNRSDMAGGSTLGNISNNQVAIPTADIGLPQLAMHSPFETAGTKDTEDLVRIMRQFFL
ncbi:MAG: M18 family aminopeptidase [Eubacterium sp.]|nr:M18 family aminopeptidase [Eubacterium sp.]